MDDYEAVVVSVVLLHNLSYMTDICQIDAARVNQVIKLLYPKANARVKRRFRCYQNVLIKLHVLRLDVVRVIEGSVSFETLS